MVQTLFEDNEDSNDSNSNESNNMTKKPTSFVNFFKDDSEAEEENVKTKTGATSIYVENTDIEDESWTNK